jgi:Ca-activated chloride channel family protein
MKLLRLDRSILAQALTLTFCWCFLGCEQIPDPRLFLENKLGQKFMEAQNFVESRDHFAAALEYDPFRPELHTNLGLGFLLSQDPDKALQSFKKSEDYSVGLRQEAPLRFVNRFNQGVVHSMQGRIDEALAGYQQALAINPDSLETKTNIELLVQSQQNQSEGDSKNSDPNKEKDSKKDSDKSKDGKDQDGKDQKDKDQKDKDKDQKDKDKKDEKDKNRDYKANQKYKPREFKGELNPADVNKILGEIKSQEQKIRANYNKSEAKDKPRDKDW